MLNYFYKTFLIAILCGSFLSLQTSTAFAAGTISSDSKGVVTSTQSYQLNKASDEDMLASLGMLSGGFIASRMLKSYRPVTSDVMIAGAAGVAFIAGEILSNIKFKGTIDEMTLEVVRKNDGKLDEEQIQRLQDLKKSYEEAKSAIKIKKTLQSASAVGFGVASATAGYMAYKEYMAAARCTEAIGASLLALKTCAEATIPSPASSLSKAGCAACSMQVLELQTSLATIKASRTSPSPSNSAALVVEPAQAKALIPRCVDLIPGAVTPVAVSAKIKLTCGKSIVLEIDAQAKGVDASSNQGSHSDKLLNEILFKNSAPTYSYESFQSRDISENGMIKTALDFFFPAAEASWMPMLGLGAGALASFVAGTSAAATQFDMYMFVPFNRSLAFAALGGVALLSAKSSQRLMDEIDVNISKIDGIIKNLNKLANGLKPQKLTSQQINIKTIKPGNQAIIPFSKNNIKTDCLMNNSNENCTSAASQLPSLPGFSSLPDSFKDLASQTVSLGDKLSGSKGLSGATFASAESLGNKQTALAKLLATKNKALEKISNGKVNPKNEQDKFADKMKAAWKRSLQKQGMSASGMMASIGSSGISGAGSNNDSKALESAPKASAYNGAVVDLSASGNGKDGESLNLDFKEAPAENITGVDMSGVVSPDDPEPDYEMSSSEINGKNGPSLFEVISGRYIKSGYPKLLEEEPSKN